MEENNWRPFRLRKNGTCVSHLFFADDLFLFADDLFLFVEANMEQAAIIRACLDDFCEVSGEKVNNAKSKIFFSRMLTTRGLRRLVISWVLLPVMTWGSILVFLYITKGSLRILLIIYWRKLISVYLS